MTTVNEEFANFEAKLSEDNPLQEYMKLMDDKMKADVIIPNEVFRLCWTKISGAAREAIWNLLFNEKKQSQNEQFKKAAEFLKMHKGDACFYQAKDYNEWIVLVRDELLKRKMIDFWKNEMVQNELGPCWARDSDLFDYTDDPEPAKFYKYADCEAPWLKKKPRTAVGNTEDMIASSLLTKDSSRSKKTLKKISVETPLQDYKYNMETQGKISGDDDEAYNKIFQEARDVVWKLLFGELALTLENSQKAAELLEEYKSDACFYNPWDYNDWIPLVKDELIKRKYFSFWQDVIVKQELGLCCAKDSDYFDDMEDSKPVEFYKVSEDLSKQQNE